MPTLPPITKGKCPFCSEPVTRHGVMSVYRCGTTGPDQRGDFATGRACDVNTFTREINRLNERIEELEKNPPVSVKTILQECQRLYEKVGELRDSLPNAVVTVELPDLEALPYEHLEAALRNAPDTWTIGLMEPLVMKAIQMPFFKEPVEGLIECVRRMAERTAKALNDGR